MSTYGRMMDLGAGTDPAARGAALGGRGSIPALLAALLAAGGCYAEPRETVELESNPEVAVLPRTPHLRTFPCVEQCHADREPDPTKRPLDEFHTLRTIRHGESMFWCPFCHKPDDLDQLQLLDGTEVPFDSSYRLCGQCHGDRRRDWGQGIHGLSTGSWQGTRQRRGCPVCHDPHDPHRPTFEALPPPVDAPGVSEVPHD